MMAAEPRREDDYQDQQEQAQTNQAEDQAGLGESPVRCALASL